MDHPHNPNQPYGSAYDMAGIADPSSITDPWLRHMIETGMTKPTIMGPTTLAQILQGRLDDQRVRANAARIAAGPRVPNALDPPRRRTDT